MYGLEGSCFVKVCLFLGCRMREGRIASKIFNGEVLFGMFLSNENAAQSHVFGAFFFSPTMSGKWVWRTSIAHLTGDQPFQWAHIGLACEIASWARDGVVQLCMLPWMGCSSSGRGPLCCQSPLNSMTDCPTILLNAICAPRGLGCCFPYFCIPGSWLQYKTEYRLIQYLLRNKDSLNSQHHDMCYDGWRTEDVSRQF